MSILETRTKVHKLNRQAVDPPPCIHPHDPTRRYSNLSGHQKEEIRTALLTIQGHRCAYCERRTADGPTDGHIEHFRNQAGHEHLETDWDNVFWSCNDEGSCGKRKDKCNKVSSQGPLRIFDPADIIKPCTDDPEHFMLFVSDGTISPKDGLTADEQRRYSETLRVFQIADSPLLRRSREDAVKPYIGALNALRQAGLEHLRNFIVGEIARVESAPYATAIRQFLCSNLP